MMIRFVPTDGAQTAERLSAAFFHFSCTESVTRASRLVFPSETCLDGSVWVAVNTEFSVPVLADAVLGQDIADILQPWIDVGLLPASAPAELDAIVQAHRGQRLVLWDAFPQLFKDQSKTREELVSLGLLPSPALQLPPP